MNTLYLKYVLEVERSGSISQAAQNLYMAQPNLSKAIKDLESELGYNIFRRTSTGVSVTERGTEFLFHARKMMDQVVEIEKLSKRIDVQSKQFKISIPRGSYIANGVTSFVSELPSSQRIDVTIKETNALQTISNVADKGYNMGIIRYQVSDEEIFRNRLNNNKLNFETLWEFEYLLVMSKEHPLARKEKIYVEDLRDYLRITHVDIEMSHTNCDEEEIGDEKNGKTVYVYERGSQFDLLANIPTTYMWVSPIPQDTLDKYNLVQLDCVDNKKVYKDILIYKKGYKLTELDKKFITTLCNAKRKNFK